MSAIVREVLFSISCVYQYYGKIVTAVMMKLSEEMSTGHTIMPLNLPCSSTVPWTHNKISCACTTSVLLLISSFIALCLAISLKIGKCCVGN